MFILTDGKNYVMENPMKSGDYLSTTSPVQAKEFTYKQARSMTRNKKKSLSWVKKYYILNKETGNIEKDIPGCSNDGVFCNDKEFNFDYKIVEEINNEVDSLVGLAAWDMNQLNTYKSMLVQGLQKNIMIPQFLIFNMHEWINVRLHTFEQRLMESSMI